MPAYFSNTIYYGSVGGPIQAFTITSAKLSTRATAHTANSFGYPGATPSISANGTSNGIVWAVENSSPPFCMPSSQHAERTLQQHQAAGGRDHFGNGNNSSAHNVNGKVFVGTPNGVAIFGTLP